MKNGLIFSIVILFCLQGCVAVQTFPTAARAGDTVTLAVGSAEGMTKENTTVIYIPDASPESPINIPSTNIRAIVPVYPDKRSNAWSNSIATGIDFTTGHGAWLTVLVLDLPDALPQGTGVLKVQTSASYSSFSGGVNDTDIGIEILPGVGVSNNFKYINPSNGLAINGELSALESRPYYLFKPQLSSNVFAPGWPVYGAVEIKISGGISGDESTINAYLRVVLEDMEQNMRSHAQMDWYRDGNDIIVHIVSPKGILNYYEVSVSVFFTNDSYSFTSLPTVTSTYYDKDGNEIEGPHLNVSYVN